MSIFGTVEDRDLGWSDFINAMEDDLVPGEGVLVGVHGKEGEEAVVKAAANEFGVEVQHGRSGGATIMIPSRSFLRSTVDALNDQYTKLLGEASGKVIDGAHPEIEFGRVGARAVGDVKKKIRDLRDPPNAPSTLAGKAPKTNPLVDEGIMIGTIDWTLEEG